MWLTILIYQSSRNTACLEVLNEQEAQSFFKYLDIDETLKMIDIIMAAQKDYKNVSSIIPLFQVTILKLITAKKDGMAEVKEEVKRPTPVINKPLPKAEPVHFRLFRIPIDIFYLLSFDSPSALFRRRVYLD